MKKLIYVLIITMLSISKINAQLNPMGSIYFQNSYQANPAMAGINNGWQFDVANKVQWTAIEGTPVMQSATATFGSGEKKWGWASICITKTLVYFLELRLKAVMLTTCL